MVNSGPRRTEALATIVLGGAVLLGTASVYAQPVSTEEYKKKVDEAAAASVAAAKADADKARAEASATVAQAQAADDQQKSKDAKSAVDDLKAGKLIRYGITVGFSFILTGPSAWGTGDTSVHGWTTGWMPYFAMVPAYWLQTTEHAKYCASMYGDGDSALATTVAYNQSQKRFLAAHPEMQRKLDDAKTPADKIAVQKEIEDAMSKAGDRVYWDPNRGSTCVPNLFGIYVGVPTASSDHNFNSQTFTQEGKATVSPTFSFGLCHADLVPEFVARSDVRKVR